MQNSKQQLSQFFICLCSIIDLELVKLEYWSHGTNLEMTKVYIKKKL